MTAISWEAEEDRVRDALSLLTCAYLRSGGDCPFIERCAHCLAYRALQRIIDAAAEDWQALAAAREDRDRLTRERDEAILRKDGWLLVDAEPTR